MALSHTALISLSVSLFGALAFILGVFAELKKPQFGTPIQGKGVLICKFPSDPSIAFGALSVAAVLICAFLGALSVFFPYNGKSVPKNALFRSGTLLVFVTFAMGITILGVGMMSWATITEVLHRVSNVHHDLEAECATAKTGLFGGAAFLSLDAALFWLVSQMLTLNAREDYFDDDEVDNAKGDYGVVLATDY